MSEVPEADRLEGFAHPRESAHLFGHADAEAAIVDAMTSGKMHHAWLLQGPQGIGKATLAYRFARCVLKYGKGERFVLEPSRTDLAMDAGDPVFRRVAAGGFGDLLVLRRPYDEKTKKLKTVIPVDEVRRVGGFHSVHAGEGGWRVCIVDSADEMNPQAANALLKTLEEPPARALLILVSHAPGRLLPTIKSRCRKLTLKPLGEADLAAALAAQDNLALSGDELTGVARLAEGSLGQALALAAEDGLTLYRDMMTHLHSLPRVDATGLMSFAERLSRDDQKFALFADLLSGWIARLARTGATGVPPLEAVDGEAALILRLSEEAPADAWVEAWETLKSDWRAGVGLNLERKQMVLNAFLTLSETLTARAA